MCRSTNNSSSRQQNKIWILLAKHMCIRPTKKTLRIKNRHLQSKLRMATESRQHSSSCEEALDNAHAAKKKSDMMMTLHPILQTKHTNVAPALVASHMTSSSLPSPSQAQAQARNPKAPVLPICFTATTNAWVDEFLATAGMRFAYSWNLIDYRIPSEHPLSELGFQIPSIGRRNRVWSSAILWFRHPWFFFETDRWMECVVHFTNSIT